MTEPETMILKIRGMSCQHCVKSVTEALSPLPGVDHVEVDLEAGRAVVAGRDLDKSALRSAIGDLGFDVE